MQHKRVLFFDPDPRAVRVAERALKATGSAVTALRGLRELEAALEGGSWDLVMIGIDEPLEPSGQLATVLEHSGTRFPDTRVILHATGPTEEYIPLLRERPALSNMIAKNDEPLEPEELIITAEKLLRQDLFGLQKYLLWGVEPFSIPIRDSTKKLDYVGEVASYARSLGCSERSIELIETIVDEVVTNAIYNAPRDAEGNPRYAKRSRREPVRLEDHEVGELQFACDGDYIAIAQIDPFGALTRDAIVTYLSRCLTKGPADSFSDASGGAGIGLYRVFKSLSKFVINIDPGRKTEVICLIDLRLSMKRFRQAAKSFHIFVKDGQSIAG
jgi:hypothetical protein